MISTLRLGAHGCACAAAQDVEATSATARTNRHRAIAIGIRRGMADPFAENKAKI
jgi:hypothetical protein